MKTYKFVIVKDLGGHTLDSVWGYYGRGFAETEAQLSADGFEAQFAERAWSHTLGIAD